jgi:CO/xanthine dehydrogenase Mo-binding subunit
MWTLGIDHPCQVGHAATIAAFYNEVLGCPSEVHLAVGDTASGAKDSACSGGTAVSVASVSFGSGQVLTFTESAEARELFAFERTNSAHAISQSWRILRLIPNPVRSISSERALLVVGVACV